MRHESLPQSYTDQELSEWIKSNSKENVQHDVSTPLTETQVQEHESKIAQAQMKIMELKNLEKKFKTFLKKGTPANSDQEGGYDAVSVTIPPTKGIDTLENNIRHHKDILDIGVHVDTTWLFMIPWPEQAKMIAVDINGVEWPEKSRSMEDWEANHAPSMFRANDDTVTEYPDRTIHDTPETLEDVAKDKPKQRKKKKVEDAPVLIKDDSELGDPEPASDISEGEDSSDDAAPKEDDEQFY
jgi:hypothetical protein